jgi:hypothetical protein
VLRLAVFKIRRQVFREMCRNGDSITALKYLQTQVSASVNHDDETESKTFRHLTSMLFSWGDGVVMGDAPSPVSLSQASVAVGDESEKKHQPGAILLCVSFFVAQLAYLRTTQTFILLERSCMKPYSSFSQTRCASQRAILLTSYP